MIQVPGYEEFQKLIRRVEQLEQEYADLKACIILKEWLSREETLKLLDVSETTLWRLTKSNALVHRYQGKRPFYEIVGLKKYLESQKITPEAVERRIAVFY